LVLIGSRPWDNTCLSSQCGVLVVRVTRGQTLAAAMPACVRVGGRLQCVDSQRGLLAGFVTRHRVIRVEVEVEDRGRACALKVVVERASPSQIDRGSSQVKVLQNFTEAILSAICQGASPARHPSATVGSPGGGVR